MSTVWKILRVQRMQQGAAYKMKQYQAQYLVDVIAEEIRDKVTLNPKLSEQQRRIVEGHIVNRHGMRIKSRGQDIEGRPFISIEVIPSLSGDCTHGRSV